MNLLEFRLLIGRGPRRLGLGAPQRPSPAGVLQSGNAVTQPGLQLVFQQRILPDRPADLAIGLSQITDRRNDLQVEPYILSPILHHLGGLKRQRLHHLQQDQPNPTGPRNAAHACFRRPDLLIEGFGVEIGDIGDGVHQRTK
jgi:hypothetical protein